MHNTSRPIKWSPEEVAAFLKARAVEMDEGYSVHFKCVQGTYTLTLAIFPFTNSVHFELFERGSVKALVAFWSSDVERVKVEAGPRCRLAVIAGESGLHSEKMIVGLDPLNVEFR